MCTYFDVCLRRRGGVGRAPGGGQSTRLGRVTIMVNRVSSDELDIEWDEGEMRMILRRAPRGGRGTGEKSWSDSIVQ